MWSRQSADLEDVPGVLKRFPLRSQDSGLDFSVKGLVSVCFCLLKYLFSVSPFSSEVYGGLLGFFFFFFFCSSEAVCWLSSISCSFFSLLFKMSIRTFFLQQKASVSPAAADRDTNTGRTTQCYHYYNCYLIIMIIIVRFHKIKTDFQQKKNNELEKLSVKFHHKSQISSFLIFKSKQEELINIIYKTEPSKQQTAINKNIKMGF